MTPRGFLTDTNILSELDALGDIIWERAFGGSGRDEVVSIEPTLDGGLIAVGLSGSFGAREHSPLVLKLDAAGDVEWQKCYLGTGRDWGSSIRPTSDGGYVLAGGTAHGCCDTAVGIVKLDGAGDVVWSRTHGPQQGENSFCVAPALDGGYVVAAITASFGAGATDGWLLKLDPDGGVDWQKTYGGAKGDSLDFVQSTSDGGYIAAGGTGSFGAGAGDAWVVKLDAGGKVEWERRYGDALAQVATSIRPTAGGDFVVSGVTESIPGADTDLWFFKLDPSGNLEWQKTIDDGSVEGYSYAARPTSDGGFLVGGFAQPGCPLCGPSAVPDRFLVLRVGADGDVSGSCGVHATSWTVAETNAVVLDAQAGTGPFPIMVVATAVDVEDTSAQVTDLCSP